MREGVGAQFALIAIEIDRLESADGLIEGALRQYDEGVDAWYKTRLEYAESIVGSGADDDRRVAAYLYHAQKDEARAAYPYILRSALFGTSYGILEHFLVSLCKVLQADLDGPRLSELKGDGIRRARLYLTKVAKMPVPETPEWTRLRRLGLLRNAIVHAQGDLSENDQRREIVALQKDMACFTIAADYSSLHLDRLFNLRVVQAIEVFVERLRDTFEQLG